MASNAIRSAIGFFSGLLIARGLNPSGYGDLMFLLASFTAIRSLFDMGTSTAFYTFISQRQRDRRFYQLYYSWLLFQFIATFLMVLVVMPQSFIDRIWLGHSRSTILLAFSASFMQLQVWQTFNQVGEASRKTVRIQMIGMVLSIAHLLLVSLLLARAAVSVSIILWIFICEYLIATLLGSMYILRLSQPSAAADDSPLSIRQTLAEYWVYCKPLVALSLVGFFFEFADRWLLQHFGGAEQQGYYQIAYQFSAISLIATSSIINVFWKEISEAHEHKDSEREAAIYHRVNRGLVLFGAVISGLLIPWTDEIVGLFLGQAYVMAAPVLLVMFLYPIHQSMGQIGATMFLACGQTRTYMTISIAIMFINLPLTYLAVAPASGAFISGLNGGALWIAIKTVGVNIFSVNIMAWFIARSHNWQFDWLYQIVGIGATVVLGYLAKLFVGILWHVQADAWHLLLPFLTTGLIYSCAIALLIFSMPWLIGMKRIEILALVNEHLFFWK